MRPNPYQRTTDMLTPEELAAEPNMEFEPAEFSKTGKVLAYKLVERNKPRYEKFGGLTFFEQWEKLESEIVRAAPPAIYEFFRLDRSYAYGIGLSIVLDVDVIDRVAIEQAILKFREIGEIDWQAANPVPRERLPFCQRKRSVGGDLGGMQ